MNSRKLWEIGKDRRKAWDGAVHGVAELDMTCWLNNNNIGIYTQYLSWILTTHLHTQINL